MKGQMVFEFIIATVLFFSIVFYVLNFLNTQTEIYSADYLTNELQSKGFQISEMLVHNQGIWYDDGSASVIGLSNKWPILNSTKINMLEDYCLNHYDELLEKLDMEMATPYGTRFMKIVIEINETGTENEIMKCGYEPQNITVVRVERYGITEEDKILRISVGVWE